MFFPALAVRAVDVAFYTVIKQAHFVQTSAAAPGYASSNLFSFNALVIATTNNAVTNVVVSQSAFTGSPVTLTNDGEFLRRYEQFFANETALNSAFPSTFLNAGVTYTFAIKTAHDGTHSQPLAYASQIGSAAPYPVVPQIVNWTAAQSVDHTLPFQLQWNNLASGLSAATTNDLLSVILVSGTTNIVYFNPTNSLTGLSTNITIPAYALPAGSNLTGHITITHFTGNAVTNYSIGAPAHGIDTVFVLKTRAAPASPQLNFLGRTNQLTRLQVVNTNSSGTNRTYVLQATANLTTWTNLFTTTNTSGNFFYTNNTTNIQQRIYRVRIGS
ncbi:MAG: hypothetical protein RL380_467 [Verrucomicrobiota bacterium]|jgi:hypothetical protein